MAKQGEIAPPALYEHCCRAYEAMLHEAKRIPVDTDSAETEYTILYEGFFTRLITGKLNLSTPYYTSVKDALVRMGCMRQLRRGGSTTPSQWELITKPTLELFMADRPIKAPTQKREDMLEQQIQNLSERLTRVEDNQKATTGFLAKQFGTEKQKS
jgi:hypothetical protein